MPVDRSVGVVLDSVRLLILTVKALSNVAPLPSVTRTVSVWLVCDSKFSNEPFATVMTPESLLIAKAPATVWDVSEYVTELVASRISSAFHSTT